MKHIMPFIGALAMFTFATNPGLATGIRTVNPDGLYDPAPSGYSHVVVVNDFAFIAGQGGETRTGDLAPDFEAQVAQAYSNVVVALESVGARPEQVVRLTTYVVDYDQDQLAVLTRQLEAVFGHHRPAQTLVPVPRLALDGMLFEVDAIAVLTTDSAAR